jgi:WD40 repeat protein/DNA-binding transcriptional ArsR family regulator
VSDNPFPGPRPYRAGDRAVFFGRAALARRLAGSIVAHRVVTVHGPSGAGKSSLMAAAVIPSLLDDYDFRAVTVDRWPEGRATIPWLVDAMVEQLALGRAPDAAEPGALLGKAVRLAEQRSGQPLLIYVDQLEQLLSPSRPREDLDALLAGLAGLEERASRSLQVVLSLREDYLGRFRDRARAHRRLLERAFRVGPLTAGEMAEAACAAAAEGKPAQAWSPEQLLALMIDVRSPGQAPSEEAEVQAVYAQIVCRAVWSERDRQGPRSMDGLAAQKILEGYLEASLSALGPLRDAARRLLEEHLVTPEGLRTLRTESDLREDMSQEDLDTVLDSLESAGILRANEYPGSRYFELGHDWLAKKVFELRGVRELAEEQRRRGELQERELVRAKEEADAARAAAEQQATLKGLRRLLALGLLAGLVVAGAGLSAWRQAARARDLSVIAIAGQLMASGQTVTAGKLLLEIPPTRRQEWRQVAQDTLAKGAPRVTLRGHTKPVQAVAWSPDGDHVATASADGTIRVWTTDGEGSPLVLGSGDTTAVETLAWSPDGQHLVSTSGDRAARVWGLDGSGPVAYLHDARVVGAVWSPDGRHFVTLVKDQARVWNLGDTSGSQLLRGHLGAVVSAAWSPDGKRVATSSEDTSAMVWRVPELELQAVLGRPVLRGTPLPPDHPGHRGAVFHVRWSPDGKHLVTSSNDRTAMIWNADGTGPFAVLRGHEGWVWDAEFSPDGVHVVTATRDKTARVWDVDGLRDPIPLAGHADSVRAARFSPSGGRVVTGSYDGTARVWNADGSGQSLILLGHTARINDARWSPDGSRVATASDDTTVALWTARAGNALGAVDDFVLPQANAAAFSPDRARVVTAADTAFHYATVWSADGRGDQLTLAGDGAITRVAWSPDGRRVAISPDHGIIRVWSADGAGEPVKLTPGSSPTVHHLGWSPDGRRLLVSTGVGVEIIPADGAGDRVVLLHPRVVSFASFSPDGQRVATACDDRQVRTWSAAGGGERILGEHEGLVSAVAWSPDGSRVLSGSHDKVVKIWSADDSAPVVVLPPHHALVTLAVWSPDGKRIAAASYDRIVTVWDVDRVSDPLYLPTLLRHEDQLSTVAFDGPDRVLTVSQRSVRAWDLDPEKLARSLREANDDCLQPTARRRYLGESPAVATEVYEACERAHGRVPAATDPR